MINLFPIKSDNESVKKIELRYKSFIQNDISNYINVYSSELNIGVIGLNKSPDNSINVYIGQHANICRLSILNLIEASMHSIIYLHDELDLLSDTKIYFKDILHHTKFKLQIIPNVIFDNDIAIITYKDLLSTVDNKSSEVMMGD